MGGDKGTAEVYLDGSEVSTADWYSSSPANQSEVFTIDGLSPGTHTIKIVATGAQDPDSVGAQINIDGLLVRTGT